MCVMCNVQCDRREKADALNNRESRVLGEEEDRRFREDPSGNFRTWAQTKVN